MDKRLTFLRVAIMVLLIAFALSQAQFRELLKLVYG